MNIKRAVLIGTLSAIAITLLTIGIKTKSFDIKNKTTTPVQTTQISRSNVIRTDAETTLTNIKYTKWKITTTNCDSNGYNYQITGQITNTETNINFMAFGYTIEDNLYVATRNSILVNEQGTTLQTNDVIYITGGNDTTNAELIAWLTSNAIIQIEHDDIEDGDFKPLQQLMLQILTMPFTFITQAFNVTLWPNTPYAFNISNFILSLIAIATILFIIKLFTSGFSAIGNYNSNRASIDYKKSQTRLNEAKANNIERNVPRKTESKVTIRKVK